MLGASVNKVVQMFERLSGRVMAPTWLDGIRKPYPGFTILSIGMASGAKVLAVPIPGVPCDTVRVFCRIVF